MEKLILDILEESEKKFSEMTAVKWLKKKEIYEISYRGIMENVRAVRKGLAAEGFQGKHIALIGGSSLEWIEGYLGIITGRTVAVPLDAMLPVEDLADLINRSDSEALFLSPKNQGLLEELLTECPDLKKIWLLQEEPAELSDGRVTCLGKLKETGRETETDSERPDSGDTATIIFTSGTTGKSKGVMLTHRNLAENATSRDMGYESGMVIMTVLPIHHAYCLSMDILKGISIGSVICINDSLLRVAENIKLFEPNMILMVPLMIETIAKKLEKASLIPAAMVKAKVFGKQFHTIASGGAYLNPAYLDMFKKYGIQILQGYGMTECSPVISTNLSWNSKPGSVGKLMPNCEAKVVDEELWVKGSSVMQGYYKMPKETEETLVDGWLKTGDLGYVDEDGFIFLTGRKKNLIITPNGENVSPEEIENKLGENRLIQEVLVRESEGVIEAEIFPDLEYAAKKKIKDMQKELQGIIDVYNKTAPLYKRVLKLKIREEEFEKNTTKKIKRF